MVAAPLMWSAASDNDSRRFIIKHTFLDLQNSSPEHRSCMETLKRSCSDSCMYDSTQQIHSEVGSIDGQGEDEPAAAEEEEDVDFQLAGFSDEEDECGEDGMPAEIRSRSKMLGLSCKENQLSEGESIDANTAAAGHEQFVAPKSEVMQPEPEPSRAVPTPEPNSLEALANENARLMRENQLLVDNARLAMENTRLRQQLDVGPSNGLGSNAFAAHMTAPAAVSMTAPMAEAAVIDPSDSFAVAANAMRGWSEEPAATDPMNYMQPAPDPGTMWMPTFFTLQVPMQSSPEVAEMEAGPSRARAQAGRPIAGPVDVPRRRKLAAARSRRAEASSTMVPNEGFEVKNHKHGAEVDERSTVMLRNLPNNYTRAMLLDMLDTQGFNGCYDFVYLPIDFRTNACLGYAFVNLIDTSLVSKFWNHFEGFSKWILPSRKVCYVSWCGPHQGLEAHIERYRNSPVMHPSVPDGYKPVVFENGVAIDFPESNKKPRAPRMRNYVREAQGRQYALGSSS